jgi:hypothetical protein
MENQRIFWNCFCNKSQIFIITKAFNKLYDESRGSKNVFEALKRPKVNFEYFLLLYPSFMLKSLSYSNIYIQNKKNLQNVHDENLKDDQKSMVMTLRLLQIQR